MILVGLIVLVVVLAALAALYLTRDSPRTGVRLAALVAVAGVILLFVVPLMLSLD